MLLVSTGVTIIIKGFSDKLNHLLPGGAVISTIITILLNIIVITAMFAMIFRFLPDAKIAWSDVWLGAGITTLLFIVGKWGLGLYLGSGGAGSAYGAAGGGHHDVDMGVLLGANSVVRRGVHAGVRQRVRLTHRAGAARGGASRRRKWRFRVNSRRRRFQIR